MDRRCNKDQELTETELSDIIDENKADTEASKQPLNPPVSVKATKVPIHGTLRVDRKDAEAIRFFSGNINGISFWLSKNYKAERLKFVFKQYGVDSCGLQKVCLNWSAFKSSQTIASLLRSNAEPIRSVASHNCTPEATKNAERIQRGGTATIIREELASFVID